MIIAMLMLGMIQPAEEPIILRERRTLALPREIAPAITPYLMCMLEDRNARIPGSRTGNAVRAAIEQLKADCREERNEAELRAREMLRTSNLPDADKEQMIEGALISIDHSQQYRAERLDQFNPPQMEAID